MNKKENIIIFLLKSPFYAYIHYVKNNSIESSIAFISYFLFLPIGIFFSIQVDLFNYLNNIIANLKKIYLKTKKNILDLLLGIDIGNNLIKGKKKGGFSFNLKLSSKSPVNPIKPITDKIAKLLLPFDTITNKYIKILKEVEKISIQFKKIGQYLILFIIINFYMSLQRSSDALWYEVYKLINPNQSIFSLVINFIYKRIIGILILIIFVFILIIIINQYLVDFSGKISQYIDNVEELKTSFNNIKDNVTKVEVIKNISKNNNFKIFINNIYPKISKFNFFNLFITNYLLQILLSNLNYFNIPLMFLLIPGSLIMTFFIKYIYNIFKQKYKIILDDQKLYAIIITLVIFLFLIFIINVILCFSQCYNIILIKYYHNFKI